MAQGGTSAYVELEHYCGFGGHHLGVVHYHPVKAETVIYAAGSAIIIEDVNDPHKQEFLRGHDGEISALEVSKNGKLIASGQTGSLYRKGAVAPVIVWDFDNRCQYMQFDGLAHSVFCVRFSPDGRFLVGTGASSAIYVWDISTGEVVYNRRTESPCFLAAWGPIMESPTGGKYPSYCMCTTYDNYVFVHSMDFSVSTMCYGLTSEPVQFPSSGLQRKHICGLVHNGFLITGTSAGDMCVFSLQACVFRTSLPICNNGVTSIARFGDILYVAGGDGRIKAVRGHDTSWDVLAENVLEAGVCALTPSADGAELVAGTRNGKLWRLLSSDLTATLQTASHTGEATDVAFGSSSDMVCTCSEAGEVFLVNLSDYMPVTTTLQKSPARCCTMASQGEVHVGYDDGFVRSYSVSRGEMLWQLHTHRGGVTALRESPDFIVTGGNDCSVRFWHRNTRSLLATFTNHRKPPAELLIDNMSREVVHSGSEDKLMVTYDLKKNKALIQHQTPVSAITGVSQRKDCEHEVVTASLDGRILFWDVDYADPTGCIESPDTGVKLRCCEVSPSGRYIAAGAENWRLYIYDLKSCKCIQECHGHANAVVRVRWSPDQKQIVSAAKDGCVIVWNFFEV
jgi:WD40 repeat protein